MSEPEARDPALDRMKRATEALRSTTDGTERLAEEVRRFREAVDEFVAAAQRSIDECAHRFTGKARCSGTESSDGS